MRGLMGTPRAVELRSVALQVSVNCSGCSRLVPVAGAVRALICAACAHRVLVPARVWLQLLQATDEHSFTAAPEAPPHSLQVQTEIGRVTVSCTAVAPCCDACALPLPPVAIGVDAELTCSGCGAALSSRSAPLWVRQELSTAMQICGCLWESDAGAPSAKVARFWVIFQGTPPRLASERSERLQSEAQERAALAARMLSDKPEPIATSSGPMFPLGSKPEVPPNRSWVIALVLVLVLVAVAYQMTRGKNADDLFDDGQSLRSR